MDCCSSHHFGCRRSKSSLTALLYVPMVPSDLRQLPGSSGCSYSPRMCSLDSSHAAAAACIHAMQYSTLILSSVIYSSGVSYSLWCVLWLQSRATHTGITTLLTCSNLGGGLPPFGLDYIALAAEVLLSCCLPACPSAARVASSCVPPFRASCIIAETIFQVSPLPHRPIGRLIRSPSSL
jgi:hypothetical protein